MPMPTPIPAPARPSKRTRTNALAAGLPDPRPVTDYTAIYDVIEGVPRVTITLDQPCIIRAPKWVLIDSRTGESYIPIAQKIDDHVTFSMDFEAPLPTTANFVQVPYQDIEVQNYQGGFVRSGAKWFR